MPSLAPTSARDTVRPSRSSEQLIRVLLALLAVLTGIAAALTVSTRPAQAAAGSDTIAANETLAAGQSLISQPRHAYRLTMQTDGNLVVSGPSGATWSSNTNGLGGNRVVMQGDGNLVMYTADNHVPFATGTNGFGGNRLVMQDDGNLVEYGNVAVWASNNSFERAIQWFYNHRGATNYEGRCETAVENAFGTSGRYLTARDDWNARAQHFPYMAAPRGALVFYNTSSSAHVAISLGNGTVFSSSAGGRIGIEPIGYFQHPLGWAYAPW